MVYSKEQNHIVIDAPEKTTKSVIEINIGKNENNASIELDFEDPSKTTQDITTTVEDKSPIEEKMDIAKTDESITELNQQDDEISNEVATLVNNVDSVIKATQIVTNNCDNKNPSDEDITKCAEEFKAVTEGFELDNSINECFAIAQEDDLPPMGRFGNILATIKRWILKAIQFIKSKIKDIYRAIKTFSKTFSAISPLVKELLFRNGDKLKEFLAKNREYGEVSVEWDDIKDFINLDKYPILSYSGLVGRDPKVKLKTSLIADSISGDVVSDIIKIVQGIEKIENSYDKPADILDTLNNIREGIVSTVISFIDKHDSTIKELLSTSDIKNSNSSNQYLLPIAFSHTKVLTLGITIEKIKDSEYNGWKYKVEENPLKPVDLDREEGITLREISEFFHRVLYPGYGAYIDHTVYTNKYAVKLEYDYEDIIDKLESVTKDLKDSDVETAKAMSQCIKSLNNLINPIVSIAYFKWENYGLNMWYNLTKFYLQFTQKVFSVIKGKLGDTSTKKLVNTKSMYTTEV